jgi:prefoldin subunit 5
MEDLTKEEIDILLEECVNEWTHLKTKLALLTIERDCIRKKIKKIEEEKDTLDILKSGSGFKEFLTGTKPDTLRNIHTRYSGILERREK